MSYLKKHSRWLWMVGLTIVFTSSVAGQALRLERMKGPTGGIASVLEADSAGTLYAVGWGAPDLYLLRPISSPLYRKSSRDSTWQWVADIPGAVRSFVSVGNGQFFVGTDTALLRSTDDGRTWQRVSDHYSRNIPDLALGDAVVWVPTPSGLFQYDLSAEEWKHIAFPGQPILHVTAKGSSVAVGLANSVHRSEDNGITWTEVGSSPDARISGVVLHPDSSLYFSTNRDVFRVPPRVQAEPSTISIDEPVFISILEATGDGVIYVGTGSNCSPFGCGGNAGLFKSMDGGASWVYLGLENFSVIDAALDAHGQLHAVAISYMQWVLPGSPPASPGILRLEEDGWTTASHGMAISWVTALIVRPDGMLVASNGRAIEASADRGQTWNRVLEPLEQSRFEGYARSLTVCPDTTVHILASTDSIWSSRDLQNWTVSFLPRDLYRPRLLCTAGGRLIADAAFGRQMISRDGGQTWQDLENSAFANSADVFIVPAASGHLIANVFPSSSSPPSGYFISADDGETWQRLNHPLVNVIIWAAASPDHLLTTYYQNRDEVYRLIREDRGWRIDEAPLAEIPSTLYMDTEANVFAGFVSTSGRERGPLFLPTGQTTWERIDTGLSSPAIHSFVVSESNVYAATIGDGVFRSSRLGETATEPTASAPSQLEVTTFPQPAETRATFRFTLPASERVSLAIFDLLGRKVAVFVDDVILSGGSHEALGSLTGLSSGVYVYRLTAGDATATGRLVVSP